MFASAQLLSLSLGLLAARRASAAEVSADVSISIGNPDFEPFPYDAGFNIELVADRAKELPSHSWEYGAAVQALLEIYNPDISVFGENPFPTFELFPEQIPGLAYAKEKIVIGEGKDGLSDGDGAVGDPASLAVAAWMLGKTLPEYAVATTGQIDYVVNEAPRWPNGAISHRADVPELWADFVYMAPPVMAYYAADTGNLALLKESVDQCGFYREVLQAKLTEGESYQGIWHHIIGPQSADYGLWSTGNAWAAGGMTRVLSAVLKAPLALGAWKDEAKADLTQWIKEIVDGAMGSPEDDGLLRNYLNDTTTGHGFGEISGSSLIAAVNYRMAVISPEAFGPEYISWAEDLRIKLGGVDKDGNPHITATGIATPAVNPLGWQDTEPFTTGSPEGNNFVLLMYAAWRDCIDAGVCAAP